MQDWMGERTPSDDVYFQFFMQGKAPPVGLNFSRYQSQEFKNLYNDVFSESSREKQVAGMKELEKRLIKDAVAIPLWHKKAEFIIQHGVSIPIAKTLKRFYVQSRKAQEIK